VDRTLRTLYLEDDPRDADIVRDVLEAGGVACDIMRVQTRGAVFRFSLPLEGAAAT